LVLREARYHFDRPGFRTRQITLVTTRLDAEVYRGADLAALYRQRWQVEVCQTQPVEMSWYPLRCAPRTSSDLRGFVKREYVININLRARHHDVADQAVSHRLALFKRELVQIVTQQAPKGFGMRNDLLPRPRLLLGAGSWLAFLLDLLPLCGEFQPPRLSCAETDNLGLIRVQ
jgi:hypothetical protein